jgi:DNA-binding response OmpR family regulator
MVRPSCPALVVHDDDAFRRALIAALDQHHFTVTFSTDGDNAVDLLRNRKFTVAIVGLNLASRNGTKALDCLRDAKVRNGLRVLILGDPDPQLRTYAPWADETLLKPVDPAYVVTRAQVYCGGA